ncbi:palmitoyltransferase ZDHHC4 isoform X1 [Erpetoichthys calabaricus]|uniref:Palmitoyltransferase n=1 Tax=Erpetoichthys calabaricus TaxID=27687 RepID=A0A8C4SEM4_ERPCA|nr:palmitoyltransferase ZDHHC4 isoform X1 [Erpetoichthys calabaricus]XP_051789318.1 palmitoyltransferase ZDHHC4 isoform X1 [Erpetoichthys calabaricus]
MDFLTLFAIYGIVVLGCILLMCTYTSQVETSLGRLGNFSTKVSSLFLPEWLQTTLRGAFHRLFHQQNRLFVALHFMLEAAVYGEFTFEVFGYCREMGFGINGLLWPYWLFAVKTYFFYRCSTKDPGTIKRSNHGQLLQVYPYDGLMFREATSCPTCEFVKPARSKHCWICNRCVHRFDHHCVWVNNCIGALNLKYFLAYLVTLTAAVASVTLLTGGLLLQAVLSSDLINATYIDNSGLTHPVGLLFIIQHLFLTFPRIVFMLGFLIFLFLLLVGYTFFHFYLSLSNKTSNEWYKLRSLVLCHHLHNSQGNIYFKGLVANLKEIFQPVNTSEKKSN